MSAKNTKQSDASLAVTPANKEQPTSSLAIVNPIDDMFGGEGYQIPLDAPLPQIKILRETTAFETPEGETVKEVVGHIIHWHHANQYYDTEFGEGEAGPPACSSSNGLIPNGGTATKPGPCRECPLNQYGSAGEGKGKACQNTIRMYLLRDGDIIPTILKAPPSSLGPKESLLRWLTNAPNIAMKAGVGTKYQPIKIKFTLHKKDFAASGFSASVLDLTTVKVLNPNNKDDMQELLKLAKLYKDFMNYYAGRITRDVATESADPAATAKEAEAKTEKQSAEVGDDCPI